MRMMSEYAACIIAFLCAIIAWKSESYHRMIWYLDHMPWIWLRNHSSDPSINKRTPTLAYVRVMNRITAVFAFLFGVLVIALKVRASL